MPITRWTPAVAIACLLVAPGLLPAAAQTTDRAELLKNTRYAERDLKPVFRKLTAAELRASVKVTSGRSSALFGFNAPSIEVHLPRIDNSVYVVDEWEMPKLYDETGRVLGFEKEQGLYDHRTFNTEIRLTDSDGKPKKFAKAVGSMTISYPTAMHTVSVTKADTKRGAELGILIDGPYVKAYEDKIAEASFGNDLEAVRAYDKAGNRLQRVQGYSSSGSDETGQYRGWAYHGEVARVDADVIDERAGLKIDYEMPPSPLLPDSMAGSSSKAADMVPETPGGKFTLTPFRVIPPSVLGGWASYSADEAKQALIDNYDVREANGDAMLRAATEGNADVIRLCLAAGVDPDAGGPGMTPLILAASYAHVEAGKVLIAAGADVNARDETGSTAILRAAGRCEATELVEALIKAKADVNLVPKGGITPFGMANAVKCADNAAAIRRAGGK
jgi:hypothetical protein